MQLTINVPDTLPQERLAQIIKEVEQSLIAEVEFYDNFFKQQSVKNVDELENLKKSKQINKELLNKIDALYIKGKSSPESDSNYEKSQISNVVKMADLVMDEVLVILNNEKFNDNKFFVLTYESLWIVSLMTNSFEKIQIQNIDSLHCDDKENYFIVQENKLYFYRYTKFEAFFDFLADYSRLDKNLIKKPVDLVEALFSISPINPSNFFRKNSL